MTISNANNNLASLVSRIEQLEAQQDIWKKNTMAHQLLVCQIVSKNR